MTASAVSFPASASSIIFLAIGGGVPGTYFLLYSTSMPGYFFSNDFFPA